VVFDSREDVPGHPDAVDRYKEGYKEAMRDIWRWLSVTENIFSADYAEKLKEFIQSQIKSAE